MHHAYLDALSRRRGPLSALDPRAKIALTLAAVLGVAAVSRPSALLPHLALAALAALLARLPPRWLAGRLALVLPFAAVVGLVLPFTTPGAALVTADWGAFRLVLTREGLERAGVLTARALLAATFALALVASTPFPRLLAGMRRLGVPALLVVVLAFLYRYLYVLVDEAMRVRRAAAVRGYGRRARLAGAGGMLGTLVLRSYERAERVYLAMKARGFDGVVRTLDPLRFRGRDAAALFAGLALVLAAVLSAHALAGGRP